ncbi:hypothetical protein Avbf_11586 [Armadillidium vulgare]|nr:hypothetical protein Avbf_11586 [Armadillidium vulgare]
MGHLIKNILEYFFMHIKHMKKYLKNHTIKEGKEQRRTGTTLISNLFKSNSVLSFIYHSNT